MLKLVYLSVLLSTNNRKVKYPTPFYLNIEMRLKIRFLFSKIWESFLNKTGLDKIEYLLIMVARLG